MIQPGLLFREVPQRQRREMVEETAADLEDDLLADPRQPQPGGGAEQPGGGVDADVRDHVVPEARLVVLADAVVDRVADEVPADDGGGGRDRCE